MIERLEPSQLAIVGGNEGDIAKFIESDLKIRSGMCPNGHGLMTEADGIQECPKCGFFTNRPAQKELQ